MGWSIELSSLIPFNSCLLCVRSVLSAPQALAHTIKKPSIVLIKKKKKKSVRGGRRTFCGYYTEFGITFFVS